MQGKNMSLFLLGCFWAPKRESGSFSNEEMPQALWKERMCIVRWVWVCVCVPACMCVRVWVCVCDKVQVGHGVTHWWTWATSSEGRETGTCVGLTWDILRGYFAVQLSNSYWILAIPLIIELVDVLQVNSEILQQPLNVLQYICNFSWNPK